MSELQPLRIEAGKPLPDLKTIDWSRVSVIEAWGPLNFDEAAHVRQAQMVGHKTIEMKDDAAKAAIDPREE